MILNFNQQIEAQNPCEDLILESYILFKNKYIQIQDIIKMIDETLSPCILLLILLFAIELSAFSFLTVKNIFYGSFKLAKIPIVFLIMVIIRFSIICLTVERMNAEVYNCEN